MVAGINTININSDLGEGTGVDELIMPLINSCSIACGGHYGTKQTVLETLKLAKKYGLKVGAHPAYPDPENFGRKVLAIPAEELAVSIKSQLSLFLSCCDELAMTINHIKPHGALYNHSAQDKETCDVLLQVYKELNLKCPFYSLPNSLLAQQKNYAIPIIKEAFIDRAYTKDGRLAPRNQVGAVIYEPEVAWKQLEQLINRESVNCITGEVVPIQASTFCIHGDSPNAVAMLTYINKQLQTLNKGANQ